MRNFAKLMLATSFILGLTSAAQAWDDFSQLNDQQIAHIVLTANRAEVEAGNLALQKAQNQAIKDFAQQLVKDHTEATAQATALFIKIGVAPADNDVSRSFQKTSSDQMKQLGNLSGADFDKGFIAQQLSVHQQLVQSLDQQLIPAAKNNELKSYLQSFRAKIDEHHKKLQQLQGQVR